MIYIVIPVHNRIEKTIKCLNSIYMQNENDIQIVVVDDGSNDGTKQILQEEYPRITLLTGTGSLFWTGAVHYGINYILTICDKDDWVLLVNNDVQLGINTVNELVKFSETHDKKVIVNALSVDSKDKDTIIKSGTIVKSWFFNWTHHVFHNYKLVDLESKKEVEVDLLTGRCLLHPVEIFMEIGNYNSKILPHYGGDDEFTARAKLFGFKLFILPSAIVYLDQDNVYKNKESIFQAMFSMNSSTNVVYRWRLTRRIVPLYAQPSYYIITIIKSIIHYLKK